MPDAMLTLADLSLLALDPPGWGGLLLRGLVATVEIAIGSYVLGLIIGMFGAAGKLYGGQVARDLWEIYTTLVRAVPELVLILLLYYAGTDGLNHLLLLFGYGQVDISGLVAGIIVLGVVQGAYSTEVLRGAIRAIPAGQVEAGRAYGMPPLMIFRRITIPAMLPYALPGLANLWMVATKDTALLAVVGFTELTLATKQAAGATKAYMTFFLAAGALYFAIFLISNVAIRALERAARHSGAGIMSDQILPPPPPILPRAESMLKPHRIVLALVFAALIVLIATTMRWDWVPQYQGQLLAGIGRSLLMLFSSAIVGIFFAVLLGIAQAAGPWWLRWLANGFCSIIRGTPLLLQLWLLYYGLGSIFAQFPEIRNSFLWPYLRQAWPYGFLALTLSFAGYEGEVMRGAFAGVPRGELEAGRAYGMGRLTLFRRIWLPRAVQRVLPTINGETVLQLKSTPLVATITVVDVYGVISKVRQDTFLTYEPLLLLALIYMILTGILVAVFRYFENKIPVKM